MKINLQKIKELIPFVLTSLFLITWLILFIVAAGKFVDVSFGPEHCKNLGKTLSFTTGNSYCTAFTAVIYALTIICIGITIFFSIKNKTKKLIIPTVLAILSVIVFLGFAGNAKVSSTSVGYIYLLKSANYGDRLIALAIMFFVICSIVMASLNWLLKILDIKKPVVATQNSKPNIKK